MICTFPQLLAPGDDELVVVVEPLRLERAEAPAALVVRLRSRHVDTAERLARSLREDTDEPRAEDRDAEVVFPDVVAAVEDGGGDVLPALRLQRADDRPLPRGV